MEKNILNFVVYWAINVRNVAPKKGRTVLGEKNNIDNCLLKFLDEESTMNSNI